MQYVHTDPITTVDLLCSILKTFRRRLAAEELFELSSRLQLSSSPWQDYLTFDPHRFCFQTVYDSPHFEINMIGWRSGQFYSPPLRPLAERQYHER